MRIEINPRSLLNLERICQVLYKLHPRVLDYLVEMERNWGGILGELNLNNPSEKEREFLANYYKVQDYSVEEEIEEEIGEEEIKENVNGFIFNELRKYIQLDPDEYIPIKIYVEDHVIGRKVKELVEALEKTRAPEQFYFNKKELDEDAYFAEGYGLTMNEEQKKELDDFLDKEDVVKLKELLIKEKLYP